ncbi:MAG: transglutaminase-like cysteine peptidase [Candidatus Phaeomarinobacter sp.]
MFILRSVLMLAVVFALAACQTTGSSAAPAKFSNAAMPAHTNATAMVEGARSRPPIGYIGFCLRHREDCQPSDDITTASTGEAATAHLSAVTLTAQKWRELNDVNTYFNRTVRPVNDIDLVQKVEWWSYAINSAGDCEDYVLEKRRALIARGWPADALLITVVRQWNGEGHAVLTVVTDKGDLILDNMAMGIVSFDKAPYSWLMRQSRQHPMHWVKLNGEGTAANTASTQSANLVAEGTSGL